MVLVLFMCESPSNSQFFSQTSVTLNCGLILPIRNTRWRKKRYCQKFPILFSWVTIGFIKLNWHIPSYTITSKYKILYHSISTTIIYHSWCYDISYIAGEIEKIIFCLRPDNMSGILTRAVRRKQHLDT